jgi:hypothetical protein
MTFSDYKTFTQKKCSTLGIAAKKETIALETIPPI